MKMEGSGQQAEQAGADAAGHHQTPPSQSEGTLPMAPPGHLANFAQQPQYSLPGGNSALPPGMFVGGGVLLPACVMCRVC